MDSQRQKNFINFLLERKNYKKLIHFETIGSVDFCFNCESHKQIITNAIWEYFDGHYKFGPLCEDCYHAHMPGPGAVLYLPYSKRF